MPIPSEKVERSHIHYFDHLRLLATVSVVFMHVASGLLRDTAGPWWELLNIFTSFAFSAVPLFLMMSGYLLLSSEKTVDVTFLLRRRLPRLLAPFLCWIVVAAFQIMVMEGAVTLDAFILLMLRSFYEPIAIHFWYMYLLIALYALSPILYGGLHALDRKGHIYVAVLIGIVTFQAMAVLVLPEQFHIYLTLDLFTRLKIYGGHLCTFLMGYYLGAMQRRIPNGVLIAATAALWAAIAWGTHVLSAQNGAYTANFQNQDAGFEVALAACVFLLFKQNAKPTRLFRAVPIIPLSLPIYLMHNILLQALGYSPASLLEAVGMTVLLLLASYLAAKTLASVKPICYLFTGMTYRDACNSCNWVYSYHNLQKLIHRQPL